MTIGSLAELWRALAASEPVEECEPTFDGERAAKSVDRRSRHHIGCQWHEFVLIAARPMQQYQRRFGRVSAGDEQMAMGGAVIDEPWHRFETNAPEP
jgi:hypothetical protein